MANSTGFFLIEVMIALALLMGIAGTLAMYQWHTARTYQESQKRLQGLNAARDALESIVATRRIPDRFYEIDGIAVTCKVVQAVSQLQCSFNFESIHHQRDLACIEVTAVWESLSGVPCTCRLVSVTRLDGRDIYA